MTAHQQKTAAVLAAAQKQEQQTAQEVMEEQHCWVPLLGSGSLPCACCQAPGCGHACSLPLSGCRIPGQLAVKQTWCALRFDREHQQPEQQTAQGRVQLKALPAEAWTAAGRVLQIC